VTVIVLNLRDAVHHTTLHDRIRVVELGVDHVRRAVPALLNYLRTERPEKMLVFNPELAVLVHGIRSVFRLKMTLIARSINTLSELRDQQTSTWRRTVHALIAMMYRGVDQVIAQSKGMADDLLGSYGFTDDQVTVIHNPVNQAFLSYLEADEKRLTEQLVASENNAHHEAESVSVDQSRRGMHEILFVGRLSKQKGLHWLLEAAKRLAEMRNDFVIRLVGQGPDGQKLKQMARDMGIADPVQFEGYQTDIIPYYLRASCTVLTSRFEGFPNVLVESIAVGTPVVSFDCPSGPQEIIKTGVNGHLIPLADVDQFVVALNETLDHCWDSAEIRQTAMRYHPQRILNQYERTLFDATPAP